MVTIKIVVQATSVVFPVTKTPQRRSKKFTTLAYCTLRRETEVVHMILIAASILLITAALQINEWRLKQGCQEFL